MKILLIIVGFGCIGIGGFGVVLPGLPTTPFLLLAASCFAKSSPRFYTWLLGSRFFWPMIRDWRVTRSMPRKSKLIASMATVVVGGSSIIFSSTTVS